MAASELAHRRDGILQLAHVNSKEETLSSLYVSRFRNFSKKVLIFSKFGYLTELHLEVYHVNYLILR